MSDFTLLGSLIALLSGIIAVALVLAAANANAGSVTCLFKQQSNLSS